MRPAPSRSPRAGGGCATRRCAKTAAASMGNPISAATAATRSCSRGSRARCRRMRSGYSSNLKRTHQTAAAIWEAGFPKPASMPQENGFRRAKPRRLAGQGPHHVLCQPAGAARQPLVRPGRRADAERRKLSRSLSRASATASSGSMQRMRAMTSSRSTHGGVIKAAIALALGLGPAGRAVVCDRELLADAARLPDAERRFRLAHRHGQSSALACGRRSSGDASAGRSGDREDRLIAAFCGMHAAVRRLPGAAKPA